MPPEHQAATVAEARLLRHELRTLARIRQRPAPGGKIVCRLGPRRMMLLRMTESLIEAHRVAKEDDDGVTLNLIEEALVHVGLRLAREA